MKQRLLSLCTFVSLTLAAMAQTTWTPPAIDAAKGIELQSDSEARVYLYNIGAAGFLVGGTAWGTHAALSATSGLPLRLTESNNAWTIYFWEGSKSQQILGRSTEADLYIDYNGQSGWCTTFTFTKVGNFYRIQSNVDDETYGQEAFPDTYLGNNPEREDYNSGGSVIEGSHVGVYGNITEDEGDVNIDWIIIAEADYKEWQSIVALKKQLLGVINTAEENGVAATDAITVLNNNDATADQISAAISALKTTIVETIGQAASDDNPVEVTGIFLINPDFSGKSTEGWTLTGSYAKTQDNSPHYIQDDEGNNTEEIGLDASPGGWLEFWKSGGIDADQDAHQVITELPAGQYRLQLDGIGLGGMLYAVTNGIEQTAPLGQYLQHVNFEFLHLGGDLTYGFKFTPTGNTAWVAVDNFRLFYLGKGSNPYILMLNTALKKIEPYYNEEATDRISAALMTEVSSVYKTAKALVDANSTDEAACIASIDAINAVSAKINDDVAAYNKLKTLIDVTIPADVDKYLEISTSEDDAAAKLADDLEELADELEPKYYDGSLSIEEINTILKDYDKLLEEGNVAIKDELQKTFDAARAAGNNLAEPLNITMLYNEEGFIFPTAEQNNDKLKELGWTSNSTAFKSRANTAEVWNNHFDVSYEIKNLPAGTYTLRTKAMYRAKNSKDNYESYLNEEITEPLAFVYTTAGEKGILNNAELVRETPWQAEDKDANVAEEGETPLYVPNTMEGANLCFNSDDPLVAKTLIELPLNIIEEGGSSKFGVRGTEALEDNCWVIWSSFEILYNGPVSSAALNLEIEQLIANAENAVTYTIQADEKLTAAIESGSAALSSNDDNTKITAIAGLNAAIAYAEEGETLYTKFKEEAEARQILMDSYRYPEDADEVIYNDADYIALVEEANALDIDVSGYQPQSNEQMQDYLDRMESGWYPFLWSKASLNDASLENPVSMGEIIVNGNFKNSSKDAWTIVNPVDPTAAVEYGGDWADEVAEFWKAGPFDISQTVTLLKDGYWRLSVDALFRTSSDGAGEAGMVKDGTPIEDNELYLYVRYAGFYNEVKVVQWSDFENGAILNNDENADLIASVVAPSPYPINEEEGTSFLAPNTRGNFVTFYEQGRYKNHVDFGYPTAGVPIRIGLVLKQADKDNWCPFDNFDLQYLGTEMPDGVNSVATKAAAATKQIFSIDGRQKSNVTRGLNIVRMSDGSVQKVLVK